MADDTSNTWLGVPAAGVLTATVSWLAVVWTRPSTPGVPLGLLLVAVTALPWVALGFRGGIRIRVLVTCFLAAVAAGGAVGVRSTRAAAAIEAMAGTTAERLTRSLAARVDEPRGLDWLPRGTACTVEVKGVPALTFHMETGLPTGTSDPGRLGWCRVRVACGEATLYGAGQGGWVHRCYLDEGAGGAYHVRAIEDRGTAEDQDPSLSIDTAAGSAEVWDDTVAGRPPYRVRLALLGPGEGAGG